MLDGATADGTRFTTVADAGYPENLRRVYNHPPFLFVRGTLLPRGTRALAVVGTRRPSPEGREQAARLSAELARRGVTVTSGLAAGIDTAAQTAALEAGGRTVAVMGTGIDRVDPKENVGLARRIAGERGALVSQFWPSAAGYKPTSPPRSTPTPARSAATRTAT